MFADGKEKTTVGDLEKSFSCLPLVNLSASQLLTDGSGTRPGPLRRGEGGRARVAETETERLKDTHLGSATRRAARATVPTRVGVGKLIEAWLDMKFTERRNVSEIRWTTGR